MANNDYPIYDGNAASWGDVSVKTSGTGLALAEVKDIKAVNSGRSLDVGEQRAVGGRVMRRTAGAPSCEASLTFYRSGFQAFLRNLIAAAPRRGNQARISAVTFDVETQHTPEGDTEIYTRIWRGCRVVGDTLNAAEGPDAQEVEVPVKPIEIVDIIDGLEVVLQ